MSTASVMKPTFPVRPNVQGQDNTAWETLLDLPQLDLHQPHPLRLIVTQHTPLLRHHSYPPLQQLTLHISHSTWLKLTQATVIWTAFYPGIVMKIHKVWSRVFHMADHSPPGTLIALVQSLWRRCLMILMAQNFTWYTSVNIFDTYQLQTDDNFRQMTFQKVDKQSRRLHGRAPHWYL